MNEKITKLMLLSVGLGVTSVASNAATIVSLGGENTTGGNWRTTTVAKPAAFDPNGDNVYGSDGYFFGASDAAGGTFQNNPTILRQDASFISDVSPSGDFFVNNTNFSFFDDPTQTPGSNVSDVRGGQWFDAGTKFSFTAAEDTEFILSVFYGGNPAGNPAPDSITIVQTAGTGGGTATNSAPVDRDPDAGYAFFRITAAAGDEFNVDITGGGTTGLTGLGFEAVPEPSSLALLGLGGLAMFSRRRR